MVRRKCDAIVVELPEVVMPSVGPGVTVTVLGGEKRGIYYREREGGGFPRKLKRNRGNEFNDNLFQLVEIHQRYEQVILKEKQQLAYTTIKKCIFSFSRNVV